MDGEVATGVAAPGVGDTLAFSGKDTAGIWTSEFVVWFGTEGAGGSVTVAVGISIELADGYSKGKGGALVSLGAGGG